MNESKDLTHVGPEGDLRMVDVGDKERTTRTARAVAMVRMKPETAEAILARSLKKGDVFAVAKIAGVNAAKETARLIPLCHSLHLEKIDVRIEPAAPSESGEAGFRIESFVRCEGKTGVEMEALTAVSVAALAMYDMCKAIDREMRVESIRLLEKTGGKSNYP